MGNALTSMTPELLRSILSYDAETGAFTWLIRPARHVHAGTRAGCKTVNGYWQVRYLSTSIKAHRLAWMYVTGSWPSEVIDHINGDKTDNRFANLRDVSQTTNKQNRLRPQRNNKHSGLLGAHFNPSTGRYLARVWFDGKPRYFGEYVKAEDAHAAYVAAKRQLHAGCTL